MSPIFNEIGCREIGKTLPEENVCKILYMCVRQSVSVDVLFSWSIRYVVTLLHVMNASSQCYSGWFSAEIEVMRCNFCKKARGDGGGKISSSWFCKWER